MMQLFSSVLAILMCATVAVLGLPASPQVNNETVSPRIMGGRPAVSGEFPSTVFLETPLRSSCLGVIIDANHLLTSCQCVVNNSTNSVINPFFVRIIAGDLSLFTPSYGRFTTRAIQIYAHPQFNAASGFNDLAVVRVQLPFPFPHNTIDLVPRNNRVLADGTDCSFSGWGYNVNGVFGAVQQVLQQPILNRNLCNGPTVHTNRVLDSMICAGWFAASNPAAGVCDGNTGGGLFCNNELVGILSFGLGCGAANQPGVYTQVRFYQQWIQQQLVRTDASFP